MYWNGIRSFIAVAEHGSFTAAAEATGLSKASLSQQVTELEKQLGVQLLYRTTRQMRLTEIGEGYLFQCRNAISQLTDANDWVRQSTDAMKGIIRMNAVGGVIGEELIAPLLINFQRQFPEVDIRLDFSSQRVDLLGDEYDLVMRMGELPDSTLIARRLHRIKTCYVASPEFLKQRSIVHPLDLKEVPLICGSVREWQFKKGGEQVLIQAKRAFQIANGRVMYQAACSGLGVARLADVYVQGAINEGLLQEVLSDWQPTTDLSLVCPPGRVQIKRIKCLMDYLIENFPEHYQQKLINPL